MYESGLLGLIPTIGADAEPDSQLLSDEAKAGTTAGLKKPPTSVPAFGPNAVPLMDSHEAAGFLGVYPRTLQRMVARGEIAAVRVGKLYRFVPSAKQEWGMQHNIAS